ncbi:hypothetical protein [Hymenobacter metallicola]|uniref:Uncharacterized protein n=1 Tax=Hymenobacter metallicola TaxID=2563114 RepID=A0A4Z0QGP4_9BACT|nr:hypothetical protein [Hymenobacter metallicola]TGE29217.1 hypothetical protein E5K02_07125 [Hymenobacter metallicola]
MKYSYLLLIPLGIGAFVAFWCLVVKLVSLMAWQPLARHFAVPELPPGPRFRLGQLRLGVANYKGAVEASVSAHGLGLATGFPFRTGHAPLLIPWQALGPFHAEKFLWTTLYTTHIRSGSGGSTKLTFTGSDFLEAARPWLQPG